MSKPVSGCLTPTEASASHWGSPLASYHPDFRRPAPSPNWDRMSSREILDYCQYELTAEEQARILKRMMSERPAPPVWYTTRLENQRPGK